VFRASDKEGQEEDWVEVVEVKLDLHENVFCKSIRVILKRRYQQTETKLGDKLTSLINAEHSYERQADPADQVSRFRGG
jgi:hypothetical protein